MSDDREITTTWSVIDKATATLSKIKANVSAIGSSFTAAQSKAGAAASATVGSFSKMQSSAASSAAATARSFSGAQSSIGSILNNTLFKNRNALGQFQRTPWAQLKGHAAAFTSSLANGLKNATSGLSSFTMGLPGLRTGLSTLAIGLATVALANLGDEFEQTQLRMAGFLTGLGLTANIEQGFSVAEGAMEKIRVQAALLPGEAKDYLDVFQRALPVIATSIGGTMDQMLGFSNSYSALTKTLGVDSAQAGRDLNLMLQAGRGRAGGANLSFSKLLPFMQKLEGQAQLNAKAFNDMTQPERAKLLEASFRSLEPMLAKAANTFDAMKGAAISNVQHIMRLGSIPLFEGLKSGLSDFNNLLSDANGTLTPFGNRLVNIGKMFSTGVVRGANLVREALKGAYGWLEKIAATPAIQALVDKFSAIGDQAGKFAGSFSQSGGAMGATAGVAAMALGGVAAPIAGVVAVFTELAERGTVLADTGNQLVSFVGAMLTPAGQLAEGLGALVVLTADVLQGALGGFVDLLISVAEPVGLFVGHIIAIATVTTTRLRPAFLQLWTSFGGFMKSVGTFLNPIIRLIGTGFLTIYNLLSTALVPVINVVVSVFSTLLDALGDLLSWIGSVLGKGADYLEKHTGRSLKSAFDSGSSSAASGSFMDDFMRALDAKNAPAGADGTGAINQIPKSRSGGGNVVQDFRFSRFDITQKFEDSISPDRIALIFSKDLVRASEMRTQSVFEPTYGGT